MNKEQEPFSQVQARVIEDSISPLHGTRITTLSLRYPRFIHSEFMTHRVFSRNASSSRAIPVAKQLEMIRNNPVIPQYWGANKPGMQADLEVTTEVKSIAIETWMAACDSALRYAKILNDLGIHKQLVNRILEPYSFISVIVTATDWDNFFALRISKMAQPEIRDLAIVMRDVMEASKPGERQYHLPYVTEYERGHHDLKTVMMLSAARCARVSYLNHDGSSPQLDKDLSLATTLMTEKHASPFEHPASACVNLSPCRIRNYRNWDQFRSVLDL